MSHEQRLTARQQRFVDEYAVDCNATQAAIRAGYSPRSAEQQGSKLLRNRKVAAAVAEAQAAVAERLEVTAEMVVERLAAIAFADLREVVSWDEAGRVTVIPSDEISPAAAAALQELAESVQLLPRGDGAPVEHRRLRVRQADRLRALELLGRHLGMFRDRVEVEHRGLTLDRLVRLADGEDDSVTGEDGDRMERRV